MNCQSFILSLVFIAKLIAASDETTIPHNNILMITMGGTKSHKVPFLSLAKGLIDKGHNVTFVSGFAADTKLMGLVEVTPTRLVNFIGNFSTRYDLLRERMNNQLPIGLQLTLQYPAQSCDALLSDPATKSLLRQRFDLVIMDGTFPDCSFAFSYASQAPFMFLNTVGYFYEKVGDSGLPSPYSITPWPFRAVTEYMNFPERVISIGWGLAVGATSQYINYAVHRVLKRHFGTDVPSPKEFGKNVSFVLQNGHFSVTPVRPYLRNFAEIACINCRPAGALPQHLEDFLSGAGENGFIYVAMGTAVDTKTMPRSLIKLFLDAFTQLAPIRVLWKFEGGLEGTPSNVRVERWLPQQDILGHRLIKAFVTHAGQLSIFEAAFHGVPVVMLPVFCDQDAIAAKVARDGYGIALELSHLTTEKLVSALKTLIRDPKYRQVVRRIQSLIKDQSSEPLQRAVYWTEYVLRHRGAFHLTSPAQQLPWYKYYMFDVLLFGLVVLAILVAVYRRLNWGVKVYLIIRTKQKDL